MKRPIPFHSNAVWPPTVLVVLFVVLYAMVSGCLWLIGLAIPSSAADVDLGPILRIRALLFPAAAGVYAAYRLWRFHPACHPAYAAWMRLSPWTPDRRLPLGPVQLVWQDAVVIGVLTVLGIWRAQVNPLLPVAVFGLVYLCGMTLLLAFTRRWWSCLVLGFLWPTLMLPDLGQAVILAVVVAMVAVVWHGHRASLRAFPWEFLVGSGRPAGSILERQIRIEIAPGVQAPLNVGWPFIVLSPKVQGHPISTLTSLCVSALLGWWSFCLIQRLDIGPLPELILLWTGLAALIRVTIYCAGMASPFGIWGRIVSGRLVIPGYDKVWLAPLGAVLVAIVGGMIIRRSGAWYPVTEACVVAAVWYVLFSGGPTLRNWVLTGQHRFRSPARVNANRQVLRSI